MTIASCSSWSVCSTLAWSRLTLFISPWKLSGLNFPVVSQNNGVLFRNQSYSGNTVAICLSKISLICFAYGTNLVDMYLDSNTYATWSHIVQKSFISCFYIAWLRALKNSFTYRRSSIEYKIVQHYQKMIFLMLNFKYSETIYILHVSVPRNPFQICVW